MATTTGVRIAGYSHVAIAVTDLAAARGFYCDLLGFEEIPRPDFGFPGMWLRVGDLQLHFLETDTMPVPGPGFPHFALHVPTEDYASTMDALRDTRASRSSANRWSASTSGPPRSSRRSSPTRPATSSS